MCKLKKGSFKNHLVDDCPSQRIAIPVLVVVGREEPGVVTLLHDNVRDGGLVVRLQLLARLPDRHQLLRQHCEELPLRHPVPEHDQPLWLPPIVSLVELLEQRHRDVLHILDDFLILVLSSVLDPHLCRSIEYNARTVDKATWVSYWVALGSTLPVTATMEGFNLRDSGAGCDTSAPMIITGFERICTYSGA